MPLCFQGACRACGTYVGASDASLHLWRDDGSITPLAHPCESLQLERLGYTWERAQREYRLIPSVDVVCADCRTVHSVYRLSRGSGLAGCATALLVAALGFATAVWLRSPILGLAAGGAYFVILLAFGAAARVRAGRSATFRARAAALRDRSRCPSCGGPRARKLSPLRNQLVRCPTCSKVEVVMKVAGVS